MDTKIPFLDACAVVGAGNQRLAQTPKKGIDFTFMSATTPLLLIIRITNHLSITNMAFFLPLPDRQGGADFNSTSVVQRSGWDRCTSGVDACVPLVWVTLIELQ